MKTSGFCCSSGIFWGLVLSTVYGILFSLPRRRSFAGCGGHLNLDICCVRRVLTPSGAPGRFLIASKALATGLTACALSVIAARCQLPRKGELFCSGGKFLVASETLAIGLTACALSVFASQIHTPPFVTCGDIFPRSGGSLSSKGEPRAPPGTSSLYLIL